LIRVFDPGFWREMTIPLVGIAIAVVFLVWSRHSARAFDRKWGKDPE